MESSFLHLYIFTSKQINQLSVENAKNIAREKANQIKAEIEVAFDASRTLAQTMEGVAGPNNPLSREYSNSILRNILEKKS